VISDWLLAIRKKAKDKRQKGNEIGYPSLNFEPGTMNLEL
jgi:hypothetical protein